MGTYMTGPLQTGTGLDATGADTGTVVLAETAVINFDATLVQNRTFTLPANAQIVDFYVDVLTAYDSATSATLSAGTTSGGTQYLSGINAKTAARRSNAFSAAQLTNMANIGNNTSVVATVTSVGQPTAGQVRVTVLYVQN
jgi:hypothetical protein